MPVQQSNGGPSGRWRVGSEPQRASPDAVGQAARDRVAKLQQALGVLGDTSGAEVDGSRSALEKAKKMFSEPTVEVQITECRGLSLGPRSVWPNLDVQRARRLLLWKKDEQGCNISRQEHRARFTSCCHPRKMLCPK